MLQQDKERKFWEDVLLPVTRICIAISRMGVGTHRNKNFQEKSSQLNQRAHSNIQASVVLAAGDASKNKSPLYGRGTSCNDRENKKQALMTAKKSAKDKDGRKKELIGTEVALIPNKVAADHKENKELEKRLYTPVSASAEEGKYYFASSSRYEAHHSTNNHSFSIQMTRRINVQSANSCEASSCLKDANYCSSVENEAIINPRQSRFNKYGVVESSKQGAEKSKSQNSAGKKLSSFSHDKSLTAKQEKRSDFAFIGGRNTNELGRSKKILQNRTACLTLPNVEKKNLRDTASEKSNVIEMWARPSIKSGLSMMEILQGINDYDCCDNFSDVQSLKEGDSKAKRRAKVNIDCGPQNRDTHDHGDILDAMLNGKSGVRSRLLGQKTKHRKRTEKTEDAKDLRIECNVDATRNEGIKSIMKSGNSHHKNKLNKREIRRVSFRKKTIRTFVPDREETTKRKMR